MKTSADQIKEIALTKNAWLVETKAGLPLVFSPLLKKYPSLAHAFSTRQGGQSTPPVDSFNMGIFHIHDDLGRQDARRNRVKLCQSLGLHIERLIVPEKQVHSSHVVLVEDVGKPGEVDGIITSTTNTPLLMSFADCVPVLIYDHKKQVVCLIHAGWRGTANGICQEAWRRLTNECGCNINDLVCAIGPAIGSCCYPVGIDVVIKLMKKLVDGQTLADLEAAENNLAMLNNLAQDQIKIKELRHKIEIIIRDRGLSGFFNINNEQIHVDLKAINAYQLLVLGISQIDVTDFCTACKGDLFYSYRRSHVNKEGNTGRQVAIVSLL